MKYKAHLIGGAVATALTYSPIFEKNNNIEESIITGLIYASGVIIGSVLPDIDEKNTFITNKTNSKLYKITKHRGLTHYPIIATIIYFIINTLLMPVPYVGVFAQLFISGIYVGLLSHYILDTPDGIYWLFPIVNRNIGKITPGRYSKPLKTKFKNFAFDTSFICISSYYAFQYLTI